MQNGWLVTDKIQTQNEGTQHNYTKLLTLAFRQQLIVELLLKLFEIFGRALKYCFHHLYYTDQVSASLLGVVLMGNLAFQLHVFFFLFD